MGVTSATILPGLIGIIIESCNDLFRWIGETMPNPNESRRIEHSTVYDKWVDLVRVDAKMVLWEIKGGCGKNQIRKMELLAILKEIFDVGGSPMMFTNMAKDWRPLLSLW